MEFRDGQGGVVFSMWHAPSSFDVPHTVKIRSDAPATDTVNALSSGFDTSKVAMTGGSRSAGHSLPNAA